MQDLRLDKNVDRYRCDPPDEPVWTVREQWQLEEDYFNWKQEGRVGDARSFLDWTTRLESNGVIIFDEAYERWWVNEDYQNA